MSDDEPVPELTDEQLEFLNSVFDLARHGRASVLYDLLDRGIPVNLTNAKGDTLLILTTYNGHAGMARELIERGADIHRINVRGQSALTCAVFMQDQDTTRALLDAGADPRHEGQSPYAVTEIFELPEMRKILDEHVGN